MSNAIKAFDTMKYRDALKIAFFEMQNSRDKYLYKLANSK